VATSGGTERSAQDRPPRILLPDPKTVVYTSGIGLAILAVVWAGVGGLVPLLGSAVLWGLGFIVLALVVFLVVLAVRSLIY
jgi:hypothetical protein